MYRIDTSEWKVKDAKAQLKNIRGDIATKSYNTYVRAIGNDLVPVLGFILDKLEEMEEKE